MSDQCHLQTERHMEAAPQAVALSPHQGGDSLNSLQETPPISPQETNIPDMRENAPIEEPCVVVCNNRKKRKRALLEASSSSLNTTLQYTQPQNHPQPTPNNPPSEETTRTSLPQFKFSAAQPEEQYKLLRLLEKSHPGINIKAHPNLKGEWIIRPLSLQAQQTLETQKCFNLQKLLPEMRQQKAIVKKFHLTMDLNLLTQQTNIIDARRERHRGQPTTDVVCTFVGKIPSKVDCGIFGVFQTTTFIPPPLRCTNCQKFGHHNTACRSRTQCGICAGRHQTQPCLDKFKNGEKVQAKCRNCGGPHHAWNKECPTFKKLSTQNHLHHQRNQIPPTTPQPQPQQGAIPKRRN